MGDGPDRDKYINMVNRLGLERVSFEGFKDPAPYYKKSKISVMCSRFEGFPMTLVESQQFGCVPVVMDSFSALHDIVSNQNTGLIVGNSVESFKNGLSRLMMCNSQIETMAFGAVNNCKRFSVKAVCDKWEVLFNEIQG